MKTENRDVNINGDLREMFPGLLVEPENESWRKACYSCSGTGRLEKNFDMRYLVINSAGLTGR
ncbi:MAG TPA: hypothetical protein PK514_07130 [Spirochaetota bacterium]|nr:hypothetical protein [Spirochaetota bacterium]